MLDHLTSPIGEIVILTDDQGRLRALDWLEHEHRMRKLLSSQYRPTGIQIIEGRAPTAIRTPIAQYFRGKVAAIDAISVETAGTPFQRKVWQTLRRIPAGKTSTYGSLATRIGRPAAVRAVGFANGANPISVVIPCHRLIGSDGSLTGYGGGLERKRWLIEHERVVLGTPRGRVRFASR
ncbi:MAG: methylated-DNA--[protein]-cysteine S-methyltransferase [Steroidobacteraceae bacterium]